MILAQIASKVFCKYYVLQRCEHTATIVRDQRKEASATVLQHALCEAYQISERLLPEVLLHKRHRAGLTTHSLDVAWAIDDLKAMTPAKNIHRMVGERHRAKISST
jgi:hypothetical protein